MTAQDTYRIKTGPSRGGNGSYDQIYPRVKSLLTSRKGRVTARATATNDGVYYTVFRYLVDMGLKLSIWLYSQLKEEDQTILDGMYDHTRDYMKERTSRPACGE